MDPSVWLTDAPMTEIERIRELLLETPEEKFVQMQLKAVSE